MIMNIMFNRILKIITLCSVDGKNRFYKGCADSLLLLIEIIKAVRILSYCL